MRYIGFKNPSTGKPYRQCEILQWVLDYNNKNINDVCIHPEKYNYAEWPPGIHAIINHYNAIHTDINAHADYPDSRAFTFDEIKEQIDHHNPMFRKVVWNGKNNGAHLTVVKGYKENEYGKKIVIMDPAGGGKNFITTYDKGVKNSYGTWTKSVKIHTFNKDKDDDGVFDNADNCPNNSNPNQKDSDGDSFGDVCDNCLSITNIYQSDIDGDGIGDKCDNDIDNDSILNDNDNCKYLSNPNQQDSDGDNVGDICDNCKNKSNNKQIDNDCDGIGDVCDDMPNIYGCNGFHLKLQYQHKLWEIINPINPIENIQIIPFRNITTSIVQPDYAIREINNPNQK